MGADGASPSSRSKGAAAPRHKNFSFLISRFPDFPFHFLICLQARESSSPTPRQAGQVDLFGPRQRPRLSASSPSTPLTRCIGWTTLNLVSGSFIDPEFAASSSDLFTAQINGQTAFLYILFDHQNEEDPFIGLRLLTYMVRIWNDHLRNNPGTAKLPPILPLVLAQDNKPWKSSISFTDLIGVPGGAGEEMQKHIPNFEFQLLELCRMPLDKILGTPMGILTLRALKAEKLEALLDDPV